MKGRENKIRGKRKEGHRDGYRCYFGVGGARESQETTHHSLVMCKQ